MALIDKASLLMVPSTYEAGKLYNVLPSGNRAPDSTGENSGYDQTRADFDFDRGSNTAATRVNADGLIEKYRENFLTYSNTFSNAAWNKVRSSVTSGATDPFGGSNAWTFLTDTTADDQHYFTQSISQSGVGTLSIYAKANGYNWLRMRLPSEEAYFDLANGVTGSSTTGISASMTDAGNGWYRCEVAISDMSSNPNIFIHIAEGDGDIIIGGTPSGSDGLFIYAAQLESSMVATDYLDSTSVTGKAGVLIDLPRIDYSSGAGALLLEPSRQQLFQYSEYFGGWNISGTITTNTATSPEGVQNASTFTTSAAGQDIRDNTNVTGTYTFSVFVKRVDVGGVRLRIDAATDANAYFDLSDGSVFSSDGIIDADAIDYGNNWWRVYMTANVTNTQKIQIFTTDGTQSYANGSVYLYGAQLEAGSYVSSYIPNHGESGGVTRAADSCSVTGASDVIGQTEGTIFVEVDWNVKPESGSPVIGILTLNNGANNLQNSILLGIERQSGGTNRVYCFVVNSNVTQAEIFGSAITDGTYKIAFAYKANDFALYVNGSQIGTDTSGSVPALSEVLLGKRYGTDLFNTSDGIKQATLFKERLSNAELAALTA